MRLNHNLKQQIEKYRSHIIIVEGKKDVSALNSLGFENVFQLHMSSVPLRERISEICKNITKKDSVCILTDLDKKGNQLYKFSKPVFQEHGVKLDSSFRGLLIKARISHIEGLPKFLEKLDEF